MYAFDYIRSPVRRGMNAAMMQRCIQRHGEIECAWQEKRDEMLRKIHARANVMGAWRAERRELVSLLHERENQMTDWSVEYLGTVRRLRREGIEAHARDGDIDVIIQLLRCEYPTRRDGRICRELRQKIQQARRTWRDDTLNIDFLSFERDFWELPRLFKETYPPPPEFFLMMSPLIIII